MRVLDVAFCHWGYKSYGPNVAYTLLMNARYHYTEEMLKLKKYDCHCLLERRYVFQNGLATTTAYIGCWVYPNMIVEFEGAKLL